MSSEELPHPSQDNTARHSVDQLIRENGYRIHTRKGDEEPLWERNGKVVKQSVILKRIGYQGGNLKYTEAATPKKKKEKKSD